MVISKYIQMKSFNKYYLDSNSWDNWETILSIFSSKEFTFSSNNSTLVGTYSCSIYSGITLVKHSLQSMSKQEISPCSSNLTGTKDNFSQS